MVNVHELRLTNINLPPNFITRPPTVVDHFDLPRERVAIFTNLLDRYLQKYLVEHPEGLNKRHFQLLSLTCLYITIKMECHQGFLSVDTMIHLSREKFSKSQMVAMEKEIFRALEWKLNPPTAYVFLQHFMLLLSPEQVDYDTIEAARFSMELAVLDYGSIEQRPSRIALAALLNAMENTKAREASSPNGERAVQEGHYNFLLSLIAPSERQTLEQCRARLLALNNGLAADDNVVMHAPEVPLQGRMVSPVSVTHNHSPYY